MAGLVPAIPIRDAMCPPKRDARVKPAHDGANSMNALDIHMTVNGEVVAETVEPRMTLRVDRFHNLIVEAA